MVIEFMIELAQSHSTLLSLISLKKCLDEIIPLPPVRGRVKLLTYMGAYECPIPVFFYLDSPANVMQIHETHYDRRAARCIKRIYTILV